MRKTIDTTFLKSLFSTLTKSLKSQNLLQSFTQMNQHICNIKLIYQYFVCIRTQLSEKKYNGLFAGPVCIINHHLHFKYNITVIYQSRFDRFLQTEIAWKLGCWWRRKFRVEKDDVELTGALNKILLENILPFHVADHFLHSPKGRTEVRQSICFFFHENCFLIYCFLQQMPQ